MRPLSPACLVTLPLTCLLGAALGLLSRSTEPATRPDITLAPPTACYTADAPLTVEARFENPGIRGELATDGSFELLVTPHAADGTALPTRLVVYEEVVATESAPLLPRHSLRQRLELGDAAMAARVRTVEVQGRWHGPTAVVDLDPVELHVCEPVQTVRPPVIAATAVARRDRS